MGLSLQQQQVGLPAAAEGAVSSKGFELATNLVCRLLFCLQAPAGGLASTCGEGRKASWHQRGDLPLPVVRDVKLAAAASSTDPIAPARLHHHAVWSAAA